LSPTDDDPWIEVGKVGRAHGVRGHVRVFTHNPDSLLLVPDVALQLRRERRRDEVVVRSVRRANDFWIVALHGTETREAAAALTHATVWAKRSELPRPADDELYLADLIGVRVQDADNGMRLGEVRRLGFSNVDVLEIALDDGSEVLVPVTDDYVTAMSEDHVAVRNIHHWLE